MKVLLLSAVVLAVGVVVARFIAFGVRCAPTMADDIRAAQANYDREYQREEARRRLTLGAR